MPQLTSEQLEANIAKAATRRSLERIRGAFSGAHVLIRSPEQHVMPVRTARHGLRRSMLKTNTSELHGKHEHHSGLNRWPRAHQRPGTAIV
jgi:hypothetical protein